MTLPATPPLIRTALSPSRKSQPSMSTVRASIRRQPPQHSPAPWMALTPSQDRAECARLPVARDVTRMVPWQPASTTPYVGSSRIAKSAASRSGRGCGDHVQPVAGGLDLFGLVEEVGHVVLRLGDR